MKSSPIGKLDPDVKKDTVRVVIETPKHGRNKFAFDPDIQAFTLSSVLPVGASFPFDFGFIPKTEGGDGDPLDVLLLMDEPAFPGCVVETRLVGV
ncbi:MAG TPA: inorganic diphosphatase, partial [Thermoanaerobaculia bacterium]|nr:inorganic diphosphatase [Thermoanaerobaculia bacterium]